MVEASSPSPTPQPQPLGPLDHPRAAFTNHLAHRGPISDNDAESSAAAQRRRSVEAELEDGDDERDWQWQRAMKKGSSSPKINPFHLISHPTSTDDLPPLPSHLRQLASDTGDPDDAVIAKYHESTTVEAEGAPLHITKVTENSVQVVTGTRPDQGPRRIIKKVSSVFRRENGVIHDIDVAINMQEPPPSPPISEVEVTVESEPVFAESVEESRESAPSRPIESPTIFTSNLTAEPSETTPVRLTPSPASRRVSSGSTGRAGSLAIVRSGRLARDSTEPPTASESPPMLAPRISRRSTNPSPIVSTAPVPRSPLVHAQSTFAPIERSQTSVPGLNGAALDSDILAQAETIRRERLERRQKKASAAEEREIKEEARVLVGNLIGEDHVNYVLMYNMLTGIRIGVSRCQAKIKRPLTDEDYLARHKYSFDIIGNELTPSAKYDFKFKDYAPWVFRDLREEHFHLDPADYLLSLTAKYILSELGSPGKSGSFFYFSRDYRFIIKTISHSEHKFLRSILKDYHEHIKTNPHSLLSRFYGLHRVKLPRGRKIHFVIMNNLFPPHRDVHETYDLKGSAYGREYPEEKAKLNPRAVLKDKNWVNRGRTLELGPEKRALLSEQLRRDMEFLKRMRVMDYSLLVGIHNMERGNRDNLRENQLSVFHPTVPRRKPSSVKPAAEASNVRKAIRRSDPKSLDVASQLPAADSADLRHFLFYQDEGGLRATDEANGNLDVIYYLGVIDICTPYNTAKKIEHLWKSMTEDRHMISCIDPLQYGHRFLNFLLSVMRGGDLSLRPQGLLPDRKEEEKPVGGENGAETEPEATEERRAIVGHLKAE
ncbi:Phosphatidylinositol-4-phosphate 5-kinase [Saitozyma podzolica]|uniref:1-phosphatidylinositol-4-phosphate 5-kinase n=1 Tax=Saitozyma podzolica TaxID=1890683 RepID=A0A427YEE7_9TREE|nr:Phosphatidylinositol-4-phosphate 5-kinase [Saitozyma podzolica]